MSELEMLVGKKLKDVTTGTWGDGRFPAGSHAYGGVHGQNKETVTFHCENGDYVFLADGDCCSQTYINSVEGPKEGTVLEVREPEWGCTTSEDTEDGSTQNYKATLVIEGKGFLDIEYRNESNGYYGGSLELLSAPDSSPRPGEEGKP